MARLKSFERSSRENRWALLSAVISALALLVPFQRLAPAAQPRIGLIEKFGTSQVTIHFDTEPNLTYTLQYSSLVKSNGATSVVWTDLYTAPSLPFPNHYIIVDTRTAKQRFYRLRASP